MSGWKTRLLTSLPLMASLLLAAPVLAADRDLDGIDDTVDNCLWEPNAGQRDTDLDGFGNRCDADLDNDGLVTIADFALLQRVLFAPILDEEADFDGDGRVALEDFSLFLSRLGSEPGPGALVDAIEPVSCNGPYCILSVARGIQLQVGQWDFSVAANGDLTVSGDVEVLTPEGAIILREAELEIVPNESLEGSSLVPDYSIGRLAGGPASVAPGRVDVRLALGRDLAVEIPLYDDLYYLVFEDGGLLSAEIEFWIGTARFSAPSADWRLVIDPTDPFLYVGGDAIVPLILASDLSFEEFGNGFGVSLSGRIPFRPVVPAAIDAALPKIKGDTVQYLSANLLAGLPLGINVRGIAVVEQDPDGNGDPTFSGAAGTGSDYRIGWAGEVGLSLGLLPFLEFSAEGLSASVITSYTQVQSPNPKRETWVLSELPRVDAVNSAARDWFSVPDGNSAFMMYFGDNDAENYFRMATDETFPIDTRRMGQGHGVDVEVVSSMSSVLDIDSAGLTMTSESNAASLHPDVVFTESQSSRLYLPSNSETEFEFTMETESRFGGINLDQYGIRITRESFQHWGRYVTANYVYMLAGEYANDGPWLEGSLSADLPYRYPIVDQVADIAGRIAAQELAIQALDREYDAEMRDLVDLESALFDASGDVERANSALDGARDALSSARSRLRRHNDHDCGTCKWYDAPCWAEVGLCEAWKVGARPALETAVEAAVLGVNLAQAGLTAAEALFDSLALRVGIARNATEILLASTNEARAALVLLREERAALPTTDGVIDAIVSLRVTRDGLTGTVEGTFQGVDFGTGQVLNDAAGPRACFVVPQTAETLCADL